jgi:hypothetical protein
MCVESLTAMELSSTGDEHKGNYSTARWWWSHVNKLKITPDFVGNWSFFE